MVEKIQNKHVGTVGGILKQIEIEKSKFWKKCLEILKEITKEKFSYRYC